VHLVKGVRSEARPEDAGVLEYRTHSRIGMVSQFPTIAERLLDVGRQVLDSGVGPVLDRAE